MRRLRLLLPLLLAAPLAGADPAASPLNDDSVFYPRSSAEASRVAADGAAFPVWGTLGFVALLAGGGVYLLRRGGLRPGPAAHVRQRLALEETRPLGNKQYLAVAAYGERRLLLAVCPGRIELLCRLDEGDGAKAAPASGPVVQELRRE